MSGMELPQSAAAPGAQAAVRAEQVRLVFRNARMGIAINLLNSIVVAVVMLGQVPQGLLATWLVMVAVVAIGRAAMVRSFQMRPAASPADERWGRIFCIGAGLAGATWGLLGLFSALYLSFAHQVFVAFVVGGMALGALVASGAFLPAYLAFLWPALVPQEIGWVIRGGATSLAMAALGVAFMFALYLLGRRFSSSLSSSMTLSTERASLIQTLRRANDELVRTARDLEEEIRERHRVEANLRESEAVYRAMFEKNDAVKLLIDPKNGRIKDANPATARYYGYPLAELKKKRVFDINVFPQQEVENLMQKAVTGQQGRFELRHRLASGEIRDVEVHSSPIELRGETLLFSIIHDVTSRKQAEAALRQARDMLEMKVRERTDELTQANRRLRREIQERRRAEMLLLEEKERAEVTLHSIGDAVITTDAQGAVEYMNPVAEDLTGWQSDVARKRDIEDVFHVISDQQRERLPNPLAQCLSGGRTVTSPDHTVLRSRGGQEYAIQYSAAPIYHRDETLVGAVLVFTDVSAARRMAKQIAYHATHDALTGLVNRREFEERLERALASARQTGLQHVMCYVDLDRFKLVNDTVGHVAGDELLKQVGRLFKGKVRDRDTLARLGGDEFVLILEYCSLGKAAKIAQQLVDAVREHRFSWGERSFEITASVGLTPITAQCASAVDVLSRADMACYSAKESGRGSVRVYDDADATDSPQSGVLRSDELSHALRDGRFLLYCQPIVPLVSNSDQPVFYEVLLRMRDEQHKLQPPAKFLPAAARLGMLRNIDRWVIDASFSRYAESFGAEFRHGMSINLSGDSLNDDSLVNFVLQKFQDEAVPPRQVCFEITETSALSDLAHTARIIGRLKDLGCRFALDDFGRGLSSLNYLKRLPVDFVKIDGCFVQDMVDNEVDHAMVDAVNKLCHNIGMKTVAEYVESDGIIDSLKEIGVDYGQGFVIGSPVPMESVSVH